jgi:histone H2A
MNTLVNKKKPVSRAQKAGLLFPVSRISKSLKKKGRSKRVGVGAGICLAASLEYICAEITELAAKRCSSDKRKRITPEDVALVIRSDQDLNKLTNGMTMSTGETLKRISTMVFPPTKSEEA